MKANELRIGSLVNDEDGVAMYVGGVYDANESGNYWVVDSAYNAIRLIDITGIPLTPEILEKCGFEIDKTGKLAILMANQDFMIAIGLKYFWFHSMQLVTKIHYVHQLQNLFFCLVGEELTINL